MFSSAGPPTLLGPKEATTKITSQVQISIIVSAYPCPSLLWSFNNTHLSPMGRISVIDNTTLVIMNVKRTDAGCYTLRAMNEIGEGEWTTELIVECE